MLAFIKTGIRALFRLFLGGLGGIVLRCIDVHRRAYKSVLWDIIRE